MNRRDRRASQFGHFSPSRDHYVPVDYCNGIATEQWEAYHRNEQALLASCKTSEEFAAKSLAADKRWLHFH